MSLLVVGLSHRSAPVPVLERASIPAEDIGKVLDELTRSESISEVVVVSTCNRIEVYADADRFHPAVADISSVLARRAGMDIAHLGEHLYVLFAEGAAEHLFAVAAGLDSMVVGESQILGQIRSAYASGTEAATVGRVLHEVIQSSLRVGKRVHTETGIDRAGASVVAVALTQAERIFGDLRGLRFGIVGAGSMGALAGASIRRRTGGAAGVLADIVVLNRGLEHAERLAATLGGRALSMARLGDAIADVDVLVSSTGATGVVIEADDIRPRHGRPLVVLDLAMPRDVDPAVAVMPDVHYVSLDELRESGAMVSDAEVEQAAAIVAAELRSFLLAQQAQAVAPTVTALRSRAAEVVDAELLRLDAKLPGLDPDVREQVAHAVRRAVDKVLHAPTVRIKEMAGKPGGDLYADALRTLFDLNPAAVDAVAAVRNSDPVIGTAQAAGSVTSVRFLDLPPAEPGQNG